MTYTRLIDVLDIYNFRYIRSNVETKSKFDSWTVRIYPEGEMDTYIELGVNEWDDCKHHTLQSALSERLLNSRVDYIKQDENLENILCIICDAPEDTEDENK